MLSTPVTKGVEEIGPYQLLEDLGPAPFGTLYLGIDTRSDRQVMLKVIPPSRPGALQEAIPWEILLQETRALFRIYHRGIPTLFKLAQHEGALLVAFEPIEGANLHELLVAGERPDRALLIDWGCQLLEILEAAHTERIVHRHLTEDQIVVTPEGHLVLTGFGLTQLFFEPLTPLPPEHPPAEPFTPQTDLYAVGLLLRRLAFASVLKGGGGAGGAGRDPLLKVLARATFPDPATRFQSAAEMAEALRQAGRTGSAVTASPARREPAMVDSRPVAVPPPVIALPARFEPGRSEDEDRRFALLLVMAALLLMLAVIATGWFLIGRGGVSRSQSTPAAESTSHLSEFPPRF